ncbi:lipopolysaccharide biosynthesis protein [Halocatena halophila]|uniref:lipopolysaccharide biosynthesis protein n=1 Tax=Halocatena halophila TaxID=2814576 RepID=UPI002ED3B57E
MTIDISDIKRRFVTDFGRYVFASIVPAVLGVALVKILTVAFSPASYGRYSLTMSYVAIGSTLAAGWLGQAILRYEPELDDEVLVSGVLFAIGGAVSIVGICGSIGWILVGERLGAYRPFFLLAIGLVVVQSVYQVVRKLLQARLDSGRAARLTVLRAVLRFGLGIWIALFILDGIVGWFVGAIVGTVVSLVVTIAMGDIELSRPSYRPALLERLLRFGVPMVGWLFGFTLLSFIDRTLIELVLGSRAVGIYSANYDVANKALPLVVAPVIQAAHPIVMNAWTGSNQTEVRRMIREMTRYYLLLGAPVTMAVIVFGAPLSGLLVGSAYHSGHAVIPFVALGLFVWNGSMIGHKGLEITDNTLVMLAGVVFACVLNVVGNIVLLEPVGIVGAALTTLCSFLSYLLFVYVVSQRYVGWDLPWRSIRTVTVAVTVQGVILSIGLTVGGSDLVSLMLTGCVGMIAYGATLGATGEIRHSEMDTVRELLYQIY